MKKLQEKLQHKFNDPELLKEALTHPSLLNNKKRGNYERLEFLGDSVLNMIVSEMLYKNFGTEAEGNLAKRRANLVCREAIVKIAEEIGLSEYIEMSPSEEKMGGRQNKANIENSMEAVIGALYLDGSFVAARKFVVANWKESLESDLSISENPKTALQEWAQSLGKPVPVYVMVESSGPSHEPLFKVEVRVEGMKPVSAEGKNKKEAEKKAAEKMLKIL